MCDENKELEKSNCSVNSFYQQKEDFIRLNKRAGWINFNELWVAESTLNEHTNSLVNHATNRSQKDDSTCVGTQQAP